MVQKIGLDKSRPLQKMVEVVVRVVMDGGVMKHHHAINYYQFLFL